MTTSLKHERSSTTRLLLAGTSGTPVLHAECGSWAFHGYNTTERALRAGTRRFYLS